MGTTSLEEKKKVIGKLSEAGRPLQNLIKNRFRKEDSSVRGYDGKSLIKRSKETAAERAKHHKKAMDIIASRNKKKTPHE